MEKSDVAKFYASKTILITGASGLIGKVLIWKLLHSCPDVIAIYVLIRSKRGKGAQHRLEEILQAPVRLFILLFRSRRLLNVLVGPRRLNFEISSQIFNNFRQENPRMLEKIRAVNGDIGMPQLGLSQSDEQQLIQEVNVVFHIAAILKLDADLKAAVNMNTEGTLRLLQLCTTMQNLNASILIRISPCSCYFFYKMNWFLLLFAIFANKNMDYLVLKSNVHHLFGLICCSIL